MGNAIVSFPIPAYTNVAPLRAAKTPNCTQGSAPEHPRTTSGPSPSSNCFLSCSATFPACAMRSVSGGHRSG
ncbi:hypothetical protein BDV06DRAFT_186865 [Aspergillus oleicola]